MKLEQIARLTEPPKTFAQAIGRIVVMMALMFPVVILDDYFHTATFAAMFGYAWGSMSTYGMMRRS